MTYLIASKMTTTPVQVHLSRVAENRSRVIVQGGGRCRARRMGGGRHYYLLVTCPLSVVSPISHYEVSPWNGGTFYILRRGNTTQHKLAQTTFICHPLHPTLHERKPNSAEKQVMVPWKYVFCWWCSSVLLEPQTFIWSWRNVSS